MRADKSEPTTPILRAVHVHKSYRMGKAELKVLRDVCLKIWPGQLVSIVGPSGAGKSTLLHLLGILDTPSEGHVEVEGRNMAELSDRERSLKRNELIGFVFQFYHLLPDFDALENVYLPSLVRTGVVGWLASRRRVKERASHLLEVVGLAGRMHHRPGQLSGGERQRVAIARALMNDPVVLLCDEPTGNLDTKTGAVIQELLWKLNEERGHTIVMVTHDEHVASYAPRMVKMVDGQIIDDSRTRPEPART